MRRGRPAALAAGLLLGVAADTLLADPRGGHPVAAFGAAAARVERLVWRPTRLAGAVHVAAAVTPVAVGAAVLDRAVSARLVARAVYVAALTWAVVGATSLHREARAVEQAIGDGDIDGARARLPALCGRVPADLDTIALRRATVESVAENTSDAAVGPLVWGAVAGPAGLVAYRAVNTLDAMVGHRTERYERSGWAAARLDDLANLLPARLTAALAALLAPTVAGSPRQVVASWRRDAAAHPSPNAGVCEAAFAGALGVRLGGPTVYPYGVSDRPWLGDGRPPRASDVDRAVTLSRRVVAAAAVVCAAAAAVGGAW